MFRRLCASFQYYIRITQKGNLFFSLLQQSKFFIFYIAMIKREEKITNVIKICM